MLFAITNLDKADSFALRAATRMIVERGRTYRAEHPG